MPEGEQRARREAADGPARRAGQVVFVLCLLPGLGAAFAGSVRAPFGAHERLLLVALAVAALAWWTAVALARQGLGELRVVVAGAIALRLLALAGDPGLPGDGARLTWEGRVIASCASPYAYAPDAPELGRLRAELPALAARAAEDAPTPFDPPLAQAAGLAAAGGAAALDRAGDPSGAHAGLALRALFALCDLLVLWPLVALLRRRGQPPALAVVWGWCPLLPLELAGAGHVGALGVLLLVSALALLVAGRRQIARRRARGLAGVGLLAGAALVKLAPLAAAPFLLRGRRGWARALFFAAICALSFLPFLLLRGGLDGVGRELSAHLLERDGSPLLAGWIERAFARLFEPGPGLTDPGHLTRAVVAVAWLAVVAHAWAARRTPLRAVAVVLGAWIVLSPTLEPWMVAWVLPFVALEPRAHWLWLAGTAPALHARELDGWLWVAPAFFVLLAYDLRTSSLRSNGERAARRKMRLRRVRTARASAG